MQRWRTRVGPVVRYCARLLLAGVVICACAPGNDLDACLSAATRGHRFRVVAWEAHHLSSLIHGLISGTNHCADPLMAGSQHVLSYLAITREIEAVEARMAKAAVQGDIEEVIRLQQEAASLRPSQRAAGERAQRVLARQIAAAAREEGLYTPLDRYVTLPLTFPPIWFALAEPPHSLIVSPRERIESLRQVLLAEGLTIGEMEAMESKVEALGYSALVVTLGGFGGLYPALVTHSSSLPFLVETAAEEWLHQYLAFTPLGFLYVLDLTGLRPDYAIATMNETLAGIVSEELAHQVLVEHYPEHLPPAEAEQRETESFFNGFMRETRLRVDDLLARGQVEEAEAYMEARRWQLVAQGYYIRKLNQAYFAFYGTYADEPYAVDPIGIKMKALRSQSESLAEFVNRAVTLTSPEDLDRELAR